MVRATDATWPFVCMQSKGRVTKEELTAIRPLFDRVFARPDKQIIVSDARFAAHDAAQRKLWSDWSNEHMDIATRTTAATIVVLDSVILRGALTALNWITPPRVPQHITASPQEAAQVARKAATEHGLSFRAEVVEDIITWLSA
jgi:hypothetical protein